MSLRCACDPCGATSDHGAKFYILHSESFCHGCINYALDARGKPLCLMHEVPRICWGRKRWDDADRWYRFGSSADGRLWFERDGQNIEEIGEVSSWEGEALAAPPIGRGRRKGGATNVLWVLGASDPEMERIEQLLKDTEQMYQYACDFDGRRVSPRTAYQAARPAVPACTKRVYFVECASPLPIFGRADVEVVVIGHNRLGDPGYDRPPAEFMPASSIGQVISELARLNRLPPSTPAAEVDEDEDDPWARTWLGVWPRCLNPIPTGAGGVTPGTIYSTVQDRPGVGIADYWWVAEPSGPDWLLEVGIPDDIVLAAAADHCLAAAYRGECPGVSPDALMRWRAQSLAAFQKRTIEEVLADIERAREALRGAPEILLDDGGQVAKDMRGRHVPELPEASAREGLCFISDGLPGPDGRTKIVCESGTPEQIRAFMQAWGPAHGLTHIYGEPVRGFAGGYIK